MTLTRYTQLLSYLGRWRGRMVVATAVTLLATVLGLAQPLLAGHIVDSISTSSPILAPSLLLVTVFLLQSATESAGRYLLERVGEQLVLALRERFARQVLALRIEHVHATRVGDLLSQVTTDLALLSQVPKNLIEVATGGLAVGVAAAVMCYLDPLLFTVALVITTIAFGGASLALSRIQQAAADKQSAVGSLAANLERCISAIRTIRIFGAERREEAAIVVAAHTAYDAGIRSAALTALATPVIRLSTSGSFLLILLIGSIRVANGSLELGTLVTLFLFTMYALFPLSNVFQGVISLRIALGSFDRVHTTLSLATEDQPVPPAASAAAPPPPRPLTPVLEFDHVSFAYSDRRILDEVSFTLDHRTTLAIVGASGAGKTTILSLIGKFYPPATGSIRLNGCEYSALSPADVRSALTIVEQDAPVLHGTIKDNLLLARPDATDDELWSALEATNLSLLVSRLPGGLDAPVGDRGSTLSGGERQRLALARAILSGRPLALLDEPTSNLDIRNEKLLLEALDELREHTSVIIVAHRLATVRSADMIIVLADGKIAACGQHTDLMSTSPHYQSLVESGLGGSQPHLPDPRPLAEIDGTTEKHR